ncbi:MAG TPA: PIG-L family deacetylase [Blastocatellia bacterium]|nr:PIG-L family deacetylase [Blastocatellia bacterium]
MKPALALIVTFLLSIGTCFTVPRLSLAHIAVYPGSPIEDERGLVALDQTLREIANPFTIVCVGARPGDEDDGALACLRKKFGARTVMLFATRGEGEDSPNSAEMDAELGAVHTREAIEAARLLGADVMFLNLPDPGYSKSAEEAFAAWERDEALRRFVRAYRSLRPDVIITRHDSRTGEGLAQATARLAFEAFAVSANAKLAPEAGSEAWEVQRFFRLTNDANGDVDLNLNEYDRVRGRTYAQMGLAAHNRFASRGASSDRLTPDREGSSYKLLASASDEKLKRGAGLLDGLAIPERVARSIPPPRVGDQKILDAISAGDRLVEALVEKLIEKRAEGTVADLRERYGSQFVRVARFTAAIERALALTLGLDLQVTVSDRIVVPGQKLTARIALKNGSVRAFPVVFRGPQQLTTGDKAPGYKESDVIGLGSGAVVSQEFEYEVAKDSPQTLPASTHRFDEDYYAVGSSLPGAQPGDPFGAQLILSAEVGLGQASIHLAALARFDIAPPVEISTVPFAVVRDWSTTRDFEFVVRVCNRTPGALAGALWVVPLAVSQDEYEPLHLAFTAEDQEVTAKLKLRLPILKPPLAPDVLLEFRREKPSPPDPLGSAKIAVKAIEFAVAEGLRVGYISGPSHWLANALAELGLDHRELNAADISSIKHGTDASQVRPACSDLSNFDAIIVDENAYLESPGLILQNQCLLGYAKQGGNLVVLSQRPDDWILVTSGQRLAPYSIKLSSDRLTFESARVKILDSEHALASKPNQITFRDFDGWIVERAVNVPREWAAEFFPLLETSDPGEDPSRGALLVARYGEGTYIFTSLSFRRQLLAGTAGAYRLFANLVSLSKTSKPTAKPQ